MLTWFLFTFRLTAVEDAEEEVYDRKDQREAERPPEVFHLKTGDYPCRQLYHCSDNDESEKSQRHYVYGQGKDEQYWS